MRMWRRRRLAWPGPIAVCVNQCYLATYMLRPRICFSIIHERTWSLYFRSVWGMNDMNYQMAMIAFSVSLFWTC
jgi:hypothetical protein